MQFIFQDCAFWVRFKHYSTFLFLTLCLPEWSLTCSGGDLFPACGLAAAVYISHVHYLIVN